MTPTIGRIVIYHTAENSPERVANNAKHLPAVVVAAWSETCVNLKILGDGPHDFWRTSISQGDGPNEWSWPERV